MSKPKTVLLPILTNLGTDYRCYKIARALQEKGYIPIVLCDRPKTPLGKIWKNIQVIEWTSQSHLDSFFSVFLIFQWRLLLYLWKTPSRLWIVEDCPPLFTTALVGLLRRREVIYDAHELFLETTGVRKSALNYLFWALWHNLGIRMVKTIWTVSPLFIDHFHLKYPKKQYELVPNYPLASDWQLATNKSSSTIRLFFQGYLRHDSNLLPLLDVVRKRREYNLTLVGDGELMAAILKKVEAWEPESRKRIHLHGLLPFDEIFSLMARADIGIHLVSPENNNMDLTWGNKVFDYACAGLPILLGPTKGMTQLLDTNGVGVQVLALGERDIVSSLEKLVTNYENYREACQQAKKEWFFSIPLQKETQLDKQ